VIGFSAPGPAKDERPSTALELYAISVRQAWWGSGLDDRWWPLPSARKRLVCGCLRLTRGHAPFYRRHGFEADGARVDEPICGVPGIRMVRVGL
jgi:hypothetical protein